MNFIFFKNLFSDFFKLYKFRLFNKNSRKSTKNVCEQWDITETKNSIKLHIFDDKELNFMFSTCCNCSWSSLYNMPSFWPWNKYKQKTNQLDPGGASRHTPPLNTPLFVYTKYSLIMTFDWLDNKNVEGN